MDKQLKLDLSDWDRAIYAFFPFVVLLIKADIIAKKDIIKKIQLRSLALLMVK